MKLVTKHACKKILVVLILFLCAGCSGTLQDQQQAEDAQLPTEEREDSREVFRVNTVDDLIAAIGPNRVIELDPLVMFRIDQAKRGVSDFYYWRDEFGREFEIILRNCPNLTIRSAGEEMAHVVTRYGYMFVLSFENCDNLKLERLKLGHHPDPGGCSGGVIQIVDSKKTEIRDSLLYGCGTEGLLLKTVKGFTFKDSIVEDCTYGIMTANDSRDVHFAGSTFRNNKEFYGFDFKNTIGIKFEDCKVIGNVVDFEYKKTGLFKTNLNVPESVIEFKGGRIVGNRAGMLSQPVGALKITDTEIEENIYAP